MASPTPAHTGIQIMFAKKRSRLCTGERRALVGVDHHFPFWFSEPFQRRSFLSAIYCYEVILSRLLTDCFAAA
jgi:hypothetical protein